MMQNFIIFAPPRDLWFENPPVNEIFYQLNQFASGNGIVTCCDANCEIFLQRLPLTRTNTMHQFQLIWKERMQICFLHFHCNVLMKSFNWNCSRSPKWGCQGLEWNGSWHSCISRLCMCRAWANIYRFGHFNYLVFLMHTLH